MSRNEDSDFVLAERQCLCPGWRAVTVSRIEDSDCVQD